MEAELRLLSRYQADPVVFASEVLGVRLWAKQEAILRSIAANPRTAARSCHGAGKSFVLAVAILWFAACHPQSLTIVTANTWDQALAQVWGEARRLHALAERRGVPLGGQMLATQWMIGPRWYAKVMSPRDTDSASGTHAPYILQVVDEASGLTAEMAEAFEGNMSGGDARIVYSGNPLRPSGPFYDAFRGALADRWDHVHISADEIPQDDIPGLTTRAWVEDRLVEWGEGTPAWQSRVLGEFPDSAEDSLIPLSVVEAAEHRDPEPAPKGPRRLGGDIARFGGDETVLLIRDDTGVRHVEGHRKWDTQQTAGRIRAMQREWNLDDGYTFVDDAGLGGGVTDALTVEKASVNPVNFGAGADDKEQFANLRAECYWRTAEALKRDGFSLGGAGSALGGQLTAIRRGYTRRGQIQLESKDLVKKRVGRSPDHADALAITFATPVRKAKSFAVVL